MAIIKLEQTITVIILVTIIPKSQILPINQPILQVINWMSQAARKFSTISIPESMDQLMINSLSDNYLIVNFKSE